MTQIRSFYEERLRETQKNQEDFPRIGATIRYSLLALAPCVRCDTNAEEHQCRSCIDQTLSLKITNHHTQFMPEFWSLSYTEHHKISI